MTVKHILNHPSGRRSFRRAFPSELLPFVSGIEHKVSLGREGSPGFLVRYEEALAQYEAIVAKARKQLAGAYDRLDAPMIAYLAKTFEVDWHKHDEAALSREGGEYADKAWNGWEWLQDDYKKARVELDYGAMEEWWGGTARAMLEHEAVVLDPHDQEGFRQLLKALNDTVIGLSDDAKARLAGNIVPVPDAPQPPVSSGRKAVRATTVPILATFDAYADVQEITHGVRKEWRRAMEALIKFLGHDDAALITTDDVMSWRDQLLDEPLARGGKRDPKTVKGKHIAALKATLKWAVQERKLPANVAAPVVVRVPKKPKLRERDFTDDEAKAILSAALVPPQGRHAPEYVRARRWIPWLCAYTGARVNEFSQLRGEDVREVEGVWTVRITPEAGTVKNGEARVVPLHPHLVEQGFVEAVKDLGSGPLFYDPQRRRGAEEGSRHYKKVGERLAKWVREEVGINDKAVMPNHGWRHTFKSRAFESGMQERIADAVQGHAPATTSRKYGGVSLQTMYDAVKKMCRFEVQTYDHIKL